MFDDEITNYNRLTHNKRKPAGTPTPLPTFVPSDAHNLCRLSQKVFIRHPTHCCLIASMMIDKILPKPCKDVDPLTSRCEMNGNSNLNLETSVSLPIQKNGTDAGAVEDEWCTFQDFDDMASTTKVIACNALSSFPFRLHDMLNDTTKKGFEDVVCWRDDGRSFLIRDKDRFAQEVLPNYFQGQTHYKSFQRQLNIYGFTRVVGGTRRDMGTYTHRLLQRGEPKLCHYMVRTKIKNKGARSRKLHAQLRPQQPCWTIVPELLSPDLCLVDNNTVGVNMATSSGNLTGNDSIWQRTPLPLPVTVTSIAPNEELLLVESTKRLQVLEERNRKILNLLEMRLSLLERRTHDTANVGVVLSSQHHIDLHDGIVNQKSHNDKTDGDLRNQNQVDTFIGGHNESIIPKYEDTLEEMEHLDNIFNICDSKCSSTNFLIPVELFASSRGMDAQEDERALLEAKQAMYPDVAAELVRIFG